MASSTINSFLMIKEASETSYAKLCDIKDYPDLTGEPDSIEATSLSDQAKTYIEGLAGTDKLSFTANYTKTDFDTVTALKGKESDLAIYFGATVADGVPTPTGDLGKFSFKGYVSASIVGKGTNDVREMKINVIASSQVVEIAA